MSAVIALAGIAAANTAALAVTIIIVAAIGRHTTTPKE